jgi:itaconate CoA-transferase
VPQALNGVTVVSIEQAVAAPFATRQLADLGARVIKIERPDGGDFARGYDATVHGLSSYFVWLNRTKESLTLDLKQPPARQVLDRLLERADVFVQNLAPGAADRLGTSAAALRRQHPRLIVCEVTGYGSTGPYAAKKAYDMLVQAETGLIDLTGTADAPAKVGISVADIAAGMYAYSGILAALLARASTGEGATVSVSLFDALAEWMNAPAYFAMYSGTLPPRAGAAHATIAPYEGFTTRDGAVVYVAIQNAREWTRFCAEVVGDPALATDPRFATNTDRVRHRKDLHALVARVVSARSKVDLTATLDRAGIAWAVGRTIEEFTRHPQLADRDRWCTIGSPSGPVQALLPPVTIDGSNAVMGDVPALGAHSDAILAECGFDVMTIARWREEGMI